MTGVLYTVATPIGNLEDMTPRAINTLNKVDYILCEDTRISSKLLSKFDLNSKLIPYHKFNEKEQLNRVIYDLKNGMEIALISDAGTPCISDPGRILVNELYAQNIKIVPIPGACAVSTFLSACPKEDETYTFIGFIPRTTAEQNKIFEKFSQVDLIFYESPNRLVKTLENIKISRGENAIITVGRELTKVYEEFKTGAVSEVLEFFTIKPPKGEIVVMLYKTSLANKDDNSMEISIQIEKLKNKGFSTKDISVILSTLYDVNKNTIYNLCK